MDSDSLHRLLKTLLDSGEAATIERAVQAFSAYGVRVRLGSSVPSDVAAQVIALTVINTAARSFEGNVRVESSDFELTTPGFGGRRLFDFLGTARLNSQLPAASSHWPLIAIGEPVATEDAICPWASGWDYGVGTTRRNGVMFAPACVAAGGLAVSEAFSVLRRDNPYAGRRALNLTLWRGDERPSPSVPDRIGEAGLWLVGLGHLGQAYAWTLGFTRPVSHAHVLQDVDVVTNSTLSTSMVSGLQDIGKRKTRVVAGWLEARGFLTSLVERRFDQNQRLAGGEPNVALFGVDNPAARRAIEQCGFRLVVDAGLGSGYRDFRSMRMRTFPGPSSAASLWASPELSEADGRQLPPAYRELLAKGAEPCGVTTLATRAVGAPFVGCVAAGLALGEIARREVGGRGMTFADLSLRDPTRAEAGWLPE